MTQQDNGGAAFPSQWDDKDNDGMTLRDYFAGQAMAGDLAAQSSDMGEWLNDSENGDMLRRAKFFYRFADAMLKARTVT